MKKTLTIIPRRDQVLVKPDDKESRESEFGIVMPENVEQETKAIGTVIAFGPDVVDLKKGDHVIYGAFAGESIQLKDIDYVLLKEEWILSLLKNTS
jgi:chaperonin GroES